VLSRFTAEPTSGPQPKAIVCSFSKNFPNGRPFRHALGAVQFFLRWNWQPKQYFQIP
jgi:hypothetical protein